MAAGAGEEKHGQETQGIDAEKGRELHQRQAAEKPVADEIPGKSGQDMAAGELGKAEGDGQGEHPPAPGRQSSMASAAAAAKNSAMPPGKAVMTKGRSQPWRQGSTRNASAIQ